MPLRGPRYSEAEAREAIAAACSLPDALRRLGMRPAGGNHPTSGATPRRSRISRWTTSIPTRSAVADSSGAIPLEEILVEGSTYQRARLKERLFVAGLKERACELCGQGELWHGRRMSLILDHINGVADDDPLENLRVVCAQLQRDARDALRQAEPPVRWRRESACAAVRRFHPGATPSLLLARVRPARASRPQPAPGDPQGRAPALRPARARDRGARLPRGRPALRRERQRHTQVASRVRIGARRASFAPAAPPESLATAAAV